MPIPKLIQFSELTAEEINDMPTLMSFNEYETRLKNHDWYFEYSDDHRVWRKGKDTYTALQFIARKHPVYAAAFKLWADYIFKKPNEVSWAEAGIIRDIQIGYLKSMIVLTYGEDK